MSYVERNADGAIKGVYRQLQIGYAEELLADDHPDVTAFLEPKPAPTNGSNIDSAEKKTLAMALAIADVGGLTRAQIKALYKAKYDSLP